MTQRLDESERNLLHQAVRLAMRGRGRVEPNPMVGCVIARDGRVIGQGFHQHFGEPHAEPNALASCVESPIGATAYVTLEPCRHTNKKTPPCVPALIAAGLGRIVVGCQDPNPFVSGRGIADLRSAGLTVDEADSAECRQLLAPFVARVVHHRPYVTLKWAQTADGKVAGPRGRRLAISGATSNRAVHRLRAGADAILIGIGAALADDPLLTVRGPGFGRTLRRVILDSDLRLPVRSQLMQTPEAGPVIIFCSKDAWHFSGTRALLTSMGAEIIAVSSSAAGELDLAEVLTALAKKDVMHLLVEPGPTLASSFLQSNLWDSAWIIRSTKTEPDPTAPRAASLALQPVASTILERDSVAEYLNPRGVYAADFPSAEFLQLEDVA